MENIFTGTVIRKVPNKLQELFDHHLHYYILQGLSTDYVCAAVSFGCPGTLLPLTVYWQGFRQCYHLAAFRFGAILYYFFLFIKNLLSYLMISSFILM